MSSEKASGRGNEREIRFGQDAEDQVVEDCHAVSSRTLFETGLVFLQSHISGIVQAVLDLPVGTQHGEQLQGRSLLSR